MTLLKIYKILSQIPEDIRVQILNLVEKNSNEISINVFSKGSEIDDYMTMREMVKANLYLERLTENERYRTHLLVTEDIQGCILGYILYHKSIDDPTDVSIISTIVSKEYRNQGILRNMLDNLKQKYKSISLTCFISKVNIYKKLGFIPDCHLQTQIGMYYGVPDDGQIMTIDDDILIKYDAVFNAFEKFKLDNLNNWQKLIEKLNDDNIIESTKAEIYFNTIK
ncbi:GNAT family N-acetyltransferase [Flavobacterium sp. ZT3R18]|uniref:GNAT family N-acetyltransferase n=1 Tax=Flavobacterium sp. ZT3R18 TaxID=2594429 RepID=UPI00117AAB38|nr:GNAT family N-acetyltransferase [Flavobacterium sp. ZT3R18]TRX32558.1 GNAT family N-acetyltransferase [Flavobacterium sp. ZT3R18]